jgi:hypothetical protein
MRHSKPRSCAGAFRAGLGKGGGQGPSAAAARADGPARLAAISSPHSGDSAPGHVSFFMA